MRPEIGAAAMPARNRNRIHATAIAIGEAGILIRGASGSGKSVLALALIALAAQGGRFARLVADDRVELAARGGRLVARPVAPLEGIVERRGSASRPSCIRARSWSASSSISRPRSRRGCPSPRISSTTSPASTSRACA